jgi:membrane protein DedA with SNARE-associated domain
MRAILPMVVTIRVHHHFHGPPLDYAGLAAAAAVSWVGFPGPGEPVLVLAGVLAAKHKLDIGSVLFVAWAAAAAGGVVGWVIGMKAGRAVMTAPGPLRGARLKAVDWGDEVFSRLPVVAVLLTPSWIAGIHRVRARIYLPTNAAGAALWACGIGLGAYLAGPPAIDIVDDVGLVTAIGFILLLAAGTAFEIRRRRRRLHERQSRHRTTAQNQ